VTGELRASEQIQLSDLPARWPGSNRKGRERDKSKGKGKTSMGGRPCCILVTYCSIATSRHLGERFAADAGGGQEGIGVGFCLCRSEA
jgi:hypothetical protein